MLSAQHPPPLQIPNYPPTYYSHNISPIVPTGLSPGRSDSPGDVQDDDHAPSSPQEPPTAFAVLAPEAAAAAAYSNTSGYDEYSQPQSRGYLINSANGLRDAGAVGQYLSESPSPIDVQQVPSLSHPSSAPPSQDRFPHSLQPLYPGLDRTCSHPNPNSARPSRSAHLDKYSNANPSGPLLDQRRMSEPAVLNGVHAYPNNSSSDLASASRHQQFQFNYNPPTLSRSPSSMYLSPSLHRGASTGSLRDLRHQHYHYPSVQSDWKNDLGLQREAPDYYDHSGGLDEPMSPLQENFSGGLVSPTTGLPYSPVSDNFYGPSPPGTGTSTSSSGPLSADVSGPLPHFPPFPSHRGVAGPVNGADPNDRKNYSFISLPGNAVKKRPRRRYDEIERLYHCSWPDCSKSYGTLNHLNAHVTMQKHGVKRSPGEFKELRKQWRKAKKEAETEAAAAAMRRGSFTARREDYDYDGSRFAFSHPSQRSHSYHQPAVDFQSAMTVAQSSGHNNHYSGSIHAMSYPSHARDDQAVHYGAVPIRRYSESMPVPWQGSSTTLGSRNLPEAYISSSLPSHHAHHSQLPQLTITDTLHPHSIPAPPSPPRTINRLPPDSTLLTPLPAYNNHSMISAGSDAVSYSNDGYEMYDNDNSRPGTGHASIGPPSSDEYDHRL